MPHYYTSSSNSAELDIYRAASFNTTSTQTTSTSTSHHFHPHASPAVHKSKVLLEECKDRLSNTPLQAQQERLSAFALAGDHSPAETRCERSSSKVACNTPSTSPRSTKLDVDLAVLVTTNPKGSVLSLRLLQNEVEDESALKQSNEARRLQEEAHLPSLEAEIFRQQASRVEVKPGEEEKNRRGYSMQLWTTGTKGLEILGTETGRGKRARHTQEQIRKKLIKACNSKSPTPKSHDLWCPFLGHFFPGESMHAAHIFPWAEGQVAMDEIIGREVENMEELNEIPNRLMLSTYAEKRLEDGDIVLVPDVPTQQAKKKSTHAPNQSPKNTKSAS